VQVPPLTCHRQRARGHRDGALLIASNTGSQLPAYAYSAGKVIWVVGAQKIVKDLDEGMRRLREYVLGLETVRARKAYGLPEDWNSFYSKILMFRREVNPNRTQVVLVNEALGRGQPTQGSSCAHVLSRAILGSTQVRAASVREIQEVPVRIQGGFPTYRQPGVVQPASK
jgi:hypothetical protein